MLMLDPLLLRVVIGTLLLCARLLIDYTEERNKIRWHVSLKLSHCPSFLASPMNCGATDGAISNFHCNEPRTASTDGAHQNETYKTSV